jgi:hypothetical protein
MYARDFGTIVFYLFIYYTLPQHTGLETATATALNHLHLSERLEEHRQLGIYTICLLT